MYPDIQPAMKILLISSESQGGHLYKVKKKLLDKLLSSGLYRFSLARHINYTGEILSFVGFSLVTGALWTMWVPAVMGLGMCTLSIREIEFYLSQRYKDGAYQTR